MIPALKAAIAQFSGDEAWRTVRPPLVALTAEQRHGLVEALAAIGFGMPGTSSQSTLPRPSPPHPPRRSVPPGRSSPGGPHGPVTLPAAVGIDFRYFASKHGIAMPLVSLSGSRACARFPELDMAMSIRLGVAATAATLVVSGCYVIPVTSDRTGWQAANEYPAVVAYGSYPAAADLRRRRCLQLPVAPAILHARLYPINDLATQTGMLAGTVTNLMTGKGRFELDYRGERLVGEASRAASQTRSGIANAYGERGTYMSCAYRMTTPYQGTGTCNLSSGERYQVHLGS